MTTPDFVTVPDLEAYRAGDDEAIIRQTQAAIRRYCGWHIAPEITETIVLDGDGSRHLWLPSLHVTAVTAVTNGDTVLDVTDDLDWSETGFIELRCSRWTERPRRISVELTHGYEEIPADLVELAVSLAARAASSPSGAISEHAGQVSLTFGTFNGVAGGLALLAHEKELLSEYRLPQRA